MCLEYIVIFISLTVLHTRQMDDRYDSLFVIYFLFLIVLPPPSFSAPLLSSTPLHPSPSFVRWICSSPTCRMKMWSEIATESLKLKFTRTGLHLDCSILTLRRFRIHHNRPPHEHLSRESRRFRFQHNLHRTIIAPHQYLILPRNDDDMGTYHIISPYSPAFRIDLKRNKFSSNPPFPLSYTCSVKSNASASCAAFPTLSKICSYSATGNRPKREICVADIRERPMESGRDGAALTWCSVPDSVNSVTFARARVPTESGRENHDLTVETFREIQKEFPPRPHRRLPLGRGVLEGAGGQKKRNEERRAKK